MQLLYFSDEIWNICNLKRTDGMLSAIFNAKWQLCFKITDVEMQLAWGTDTLQLHFVFREIGSKVDSKCSRLFNIQYLWIAYEKQSPVSRGGYSDIRYTPLVVCSQHKTFGELGLNLFLHWQLLLWETLQIYEPAYLNCSLCNLFRQSTTKISNSRVTP